MFKFLKYFGSTVLTLAVIVLILPYFVSLNSYKGEISAQAKEAIGRDLSIEGDIQFSILPRPFLKLKNIKLSSGPMAKESTMVSVKELEVVLSIMPLFSGKIEVAKIILEKPLINLEKLKNGKGNWELDFQAPEGESGKTSLRQEDNSKEKNPPQQSPFLIKVIKIKEGSFSYRDGDKKTDLNDINISLNVESFQGPIHFDIALDVVGENLSIEGTIKEIGSQIPVEAKVKMLGKKLNIGGLVDLEKQDFKGDLELKGNLKELQKLLPEADFPKALMEKYILKSTVLATADKVSLEKIDFNLSPLQARGSLVVNLKKTTGSLSLDLMPGSVHLELRPDAPQKNRFSGTISLRAEKILQLLEALKVKTKDLPPFLLEAFSFATKVVYEDQKVILKNIDLDVGKAKLDGHVTLKDWDKKGSYTFDLRTKNLAALGKLMGATLPPAIGPAKIKGTASGKPDDLNIDMSVYAANAHTTLKGNIRQKGKAIKPDISVVTTGKNLPSTLRHLGQKDPSKALGGFHINAFVTGDIPQRLKLSFQKSHVNVGHDRVSLKGNLDLFLKGSKPKVTADLSLSSLNLDRLLSALDGVSSQGKVHLVAKRRGNRPSQPKARWSHDKIDLGFLRDFDGDISLSIPNLRKGSLVFDSMKMNMHIANGILDITSLKGNLYGGTLIVKARASSQKGQPITLTAHLKNAQLKNIVPKQKEIKVVKGLFSLDTDLSTSGHSEYQYVANLSGSMNFKGTKGIISGFNLERVVRDLSSARDLGAALGLLDSAFSGGQTAFNSIDCVTSISKGEARIKKFILDAVGADITADGSVNLLKYWMDISALVTLDDKKLPPFAAHIFGPLDNPNHKLKTGKLEQYLLQNVLSGVMDNISQGNGKPEDIVKGLLGLGKKKQQAPSRQQGTQQKDQSQSPKKTQQEKDAEAIGEAVNLLKGLF